MQMWTISKIMWGHHTFLSLETLTYHQGMFLANHIPQAIESGRDLYLLVFLFSHHRVRDYQMDSTLHALWIFSIPCIFHQTFLEQGQDKRRWKLASILDSQRQHLPGPSKLFFYRMCQVIHCQLQVLMGSFAIFLIVLKPL